MFKHLITAGVLAVAGIGSAQAATPIQWTVASGGNGHYYNFVAGTFSQPSAFAAAAASTFLGQQGYLATITSQGEQDFLHGISSSTAWIGGVYNATASQWEWASGPENGQALSYFYWNGGEPNGLAGEPAIVANWNSGTGQWNDWGPNNNAGYYVEFASGTGAVPEPATWGMLIAGFCAIGAALRRRNRSAVPAVA